MTSKVEAWPSLKLSNISRIISKYGEQHWTQLRGRKDCLLASKRQIHVSTTCHQKGGEVVNTESEIPCRLLLPATEGATSLLSNLSKADIPLSFHIAPRDLHVSHLDLGSDVGTTADNSRDLVATPLLNTYSVPDILSHLVPVILRGCYLLPCFHT